MARVAPNSTLNISTKNISTSISTGVPNPHSTNPSGGGISDKERKSDHDLLKNVSEENSERSGSKGSFKGEIAQGGNERKSPEPNYDLLGGSAKIDSEIAELIKNNNLVEVFDILPTAFNLNLS